MKKQIIIREELNFRDLGGYKSLDGRTVQHDIFYRSCALGLFNEQELRELELLDLKTILDFRADRAVKNLPDPKIEGAQYVHSCAAFNNIGEDLNYSPKEFFSMLVDEDQKGNMISSVVSSVLSSLVYSNEAYKTMFRILMKEKTPILFHCSQGKDRTGIAAILILLALGVSEKQIIEDYMLTNRHRKVFIDKKLKTFRIPSGLSTNVSQAIYAVEGVIPESVHMLLAEILERYDTYEEFLYREYDLTENDLENLRDLYLEGDKYEL